MLDFIVYILKTHILPNANAESPAVVANAPTEYITS